VPEPDNTSFNELANGYITVDRNWLITSFNQKALRILGVDGRDLLGRHCREIFYNDTRFKAICSHLEPLTGRRGSNTIQLNLDMPDTGSGNAIRLIVITLPGQTGAMIGAIIGFAELSPSPAASRLALNSISEGVFTVNHLRRITSFNSAAEKITGWTEAEVLGQPCKAIFDSGICNPKCAIAESLLKNTAIADRMTYILARDGHSIPVKVSAAPLYDLRERVVGWVETFRDITTILQHELIIDAVADGVFSVDPEGRITSFNAAAEKITGWKEHEVLGKTCSIVFFSSTSAASCPLCISMRDKRSMIDHETFIIGKDGFSIPVSISTAPFLDHRGEIIGGVESFRDNTSRLQNALILDSVADGVFTVDRSWKITSFNQAAELITGWSRDYVLGRSCSEIFQSSICGRNCAIAESLYTGKAEANRSITIKTRSGRSLSVSISAAPLVDHEGNVVGGVETFRDLSVEVSLRQQLTRKYTFDQIISKSASMQRIFEIMPDIAISGSNVLILGESGTGKELIASALYHASHRKDGPFVTVNCGALPETLIESELFGYKAGAFTDARKDKIGRFAVAEGGTLFLDEIGDIPQSLQVKLLRVLQHKTYEPLGSNTPVKADVRIITATNRDLPQLVREGQFRDDLYYRLNVVNIQLPPLRRRIEDIPLLVEHFVKKFSAEKEKDIVGVSDRVISRLMRYSYPGNIRELENIIEYAFILCPGGYIQESHLPEHIGGDTTPEEPETGVTLPGMTLGEIERQAIFHALERNQWKKMITCRELQISKDTLRRKIDHYRLHNPSEPEDKEE
jgi:PAS domain S-box-containing protein